MVLTLVADRVSGDSPEDVPHSFAEILFGCLYSRHHFQWLEKMGEQKDAEIIFSKTRSRRDYSSGSEGIRKLEVH